MASFPKLSKQAGAQDAKSGADAIDAKNPMKYAPTVKAQDVRAPTIPNLPRGVTLVNEFYDNKFGRA